MAKKEEAPNMVERFAEFKELKNIDKTTMISVLEESFRNVLAKMFGTDENLDVIMNPDKGDVQIFQNLEVVPDGSVTDPNLQISLSDARADGDPDVEIGEEHTKEIIFADFGRRAILNLRETLPVEILDLEKRLFTIVSRNLKASSSPAKSIRHGRKRPFFSTTTKQNCFCRAARLSPATISARGRWFAPSSPMSTTRTTIPR